MSLIYKIAEKGCFLLNRLPGGGPKGSMSGDLSADDSAVKIPRNMYSGLNVKEINLDGFLCHRFRSKKVNTPCQKAIFFLPGGGGMMRATKLHYDTAKRLATEISAEVIFAHYPLAPEYNVRFALDWLEKLYFSEILRDYNPEDIVFIGDSAGANLILSLTCRLNVRPGSLIVISPACGLEYGKNRDIRLEMEPYDPILTVAMNDMIAENWCKGVPLDSPDISPESIDYTDFPPMLFFYGTHEVFYPHVKNYLRRLKEANVRFESVEKPMCHDWALVKYFPEGRQAINRMVEWIS